VINRLSAFVVGAALFIGGLLCIDLPARAYWQTRLQVSIGGTSTFAVWDSGQKFQINLTTTTIANDTATNSVGPGNFGVVLGNTSHSTGKFYLEATAVSPSGGWGIGIANSSQTIGATFMGNGVNNEGAIQNGTIVYNTGSPGNYAGGALSNGDIVGMAIDVGAKLGWWRVGAGNWNANGAADPATGANGYDISGVTGDLFFFGMSQSNVTSVALNTGAASYAQTSPSGFGNW
jgi:hypothetical protein